MALANVPPSVQEAALRLRDQCAQAAAALTFEVVTGFVTQAGPRAVPGARRESVEGPWRLSAGSDAWRRNDGTLIVGCWAVAEGDRRLGRHSFPQRMFAFSRPGLPRELSAEEMATKVKD